MEICECGRKFKTKRGLTEHMKRPIHKRYMDRKMKPKLMEYWFADEEKEINMFGEDIDCITKCWVFRVEDEDNCLNYHEFKDWKWANEAKTYGFSNNMFSFERTNKYDAYVFVYRIYHLNIGEMPLDYDKKDIYDEANPCKFHYKGIEWW